MLVTNQQFIHEHYESKGKVVSAMVNTPSYLVIWEGDGMEVHVWMSTPDGMVDIPSNRPIDMHHDTASVISNIETVYEFYDALKEWLD